MVIRVPYHLRRRRRCDPAVALLVPSGDPRAVLALCSRLDLDPSGRLFEVAGGFLLELERPSADPMPGAVRLRAVVKSLYVPVDAELLPCLLDDEARGLVRDWGLVFPPGGGALLFDRHVPVELNELLAAEPWLRRGWNEFPAPRRLADRLVEIAFERPEPPAETLYQDLEREMPAQPDRDDPADKPAAASGEPASPRPSDGASDEPVPTEQSGASQPGGLKTVLANLVERLRAAVRPAGQALVVLKEKAQWDWIDHSHLLRKLLHEFRHGDPAKALRRALPLSLPDEPAVPTSMARLPSMRAIYNLGDLLRSRHLGRGEANAVLPAEPSLTYALAQEYRKAAERAVEQGDFRRAAYIYGYLLRDDRTAARVLQRGGLHYDAAMIYLKKMNDPVAAARAFEAAGEVDRAIELYRQSAMHEAAGDLLRRIGEEQEAVSEYAKAAAILACGLPPDHLGAGRLWLEKARKPELAMEKFRDGWARRPEGNAVLCALEMARLHAEKSALGPIIALLDEADAFFAMPDQAFRGFFYDEVTRLALLPSMEGSADDLRDRVLESVARKLRQEIEGGQPAPALVSGLLGRSGLWPVPLVSDAEFAAKAAVKRANGPAQEANPSVIAGQLTWCSSLRVVWPRPGAYDEDEFVAGAMIAAALELRRYGGATRGAAWVRGHAAEESPDSKGRDGG